MAEVETVSPTPDASVAATPAPAATSPATEPATGTPATGTAETVGGDAPVDVQPGEAAPSEETFYNGDPKSLPPELRKHYDNMLRDYKKKTGETAEARKKAEIYDSISRDQAFVDFWNKRLQGEQQAEQQIAKTAEALEISDEDFERALSNKQEFVKFLANVAKSSTADLQQKLEQTRSELTQRQAQESLDEFAANDHKDIYDLENYGFISYQFKVNPKLKLEDAYSNAKQVYDDIYKKGFAEAEKKYQANVQKKLAASSQVPTGSPANSYTGPDPKKLSAAEALAWARKGIVVPQH